MVTGIIITVIISLIGTGVIEGKLNDNGISLGCGGLICAFLFQLAIFFIPICTAVEYVINFWG